MGKLWGERVSVHETSNIHFFAYIPLLRSQVSEQYIAKNNLPSFSLLQMSKGI